MKILSFKNDLKALDQILKDRNQTNSGQVTATVSAIIDDIIQNGDKALFEYTAKYDKCILDESSIKVSEAEIDKACNIIDTKLLESLKKAKANIEEYHMLQKEKSWLDAKHEGIVLGQLINPLETVGIYVPGGSAPLPSSVLMNTVPAKVAGVSKIIMCTPPSPDGTINPAILAAAKVAGVDEIYRAGGAQAVAAMAYGTQSIPKVDKIVGPGNIYVATAKKLVYGSVDIDMFAGPSEVLVIADDSANPTYVAADLLSQAEHDPLAASILVTTSEKIAEEIIKEIYIQMQILSRKNIIDKSISDNGIVIIVQNLGQAVEAANLIAPEHLELCVADPFSILGGIKNAGAVFLGHYSPEPLGDYFAGPNHVLPTSGTARFFSPLNVSEFMKKTSVISYSRDALESAADHILRLAEAEGLTAHANTIKIRFDKQE